MADAERNAVVRNLAVDAEQMDGSGRKMVEHIAQHKRRIGRMAAGDVVGDFDNAGAGALRVNQSLDGSGVEVVVAPVGC